MLKKIGVLIVASILLAGCSSSFVDPSYGKVSYDDLTRRTPPLEWQLTTEFQRNGTALPQAEKELYTHVERVVRASGIAIPTTNSTAPELSIVVNNIADLGEAAVKGFGTGLTFGLAGSHVTDYYEMKITLTDGNTVIRKSGYKHAIHTTVGNASGPTGVKSVSLGVAFSIVIEQLVLNALKDIEEEYISSFLNLSPRQSYRLVFTGDQIVCRSATSIDSISVES
jgi:hypothetical protein